VSPNNPKTWVHTLNDDPVAAVDVYLHFRTAERYELAHIKAGRLVWLDLLTSYHRAGGSAQILDPECVPVHGDAGVVTGHPFVLDHRVVVA